MLRDITQAIGLHASMHTLSELNLCAQRIKSVGLFPLSGFILFDVCFFFYISDYAFFIPNKNSVEWKEWAGM